MTLNFPHFSYHPFYECLVEMTVQPPFFPQLCTTQLNISFILQILNFKPSFTLSHELNYTMVEIFFHCYTVTIFLFLSLDYLHLTECLQGKYQHLTLVNF